MDIYLILQLIKPDLPKTPLVLMLYLNTYTKYK